MLLVIIVWLVGWYSSFLSFLHILDQWIVKKQLDIMLIYHYVQNQGKLMMQPQKMAKNLNLGNFLTFSRSNISKLLLLLKNKFHSYWRSYLVLTSGQKPKKSLELQWCNLTLAQRFWATKSVCGQVKFPKYTCLVTRLGD